MRVVWLTHVAVDAPGWIGSRHYHLLRQLKDRHEIHVVSWRRFDGPGSLLKLGRWEVEPFGKGRLCRVQLGPYLPNVRPGWPNPLHIIMNQPLYQRAVRRIIDEVRPDALLYSSAEHVAGSPPFPRAARILFDFLDFSWEYVVKRFMDRSTSVAAVSPRLVQIAEHFGRKAQLIPNGVCLDLYAGKDRNLAKKDLGLEGSLVVSLIGATCDPTFYFVDAVARVQEEVPHVSLLVLAEQKQSELIERRARRAGVRRILAPGFLPHDRVPPYFLATDVGLYPGNNHDFFSTACPVKIIEYSAAGCQVVSSPVDMFAGWPNVRMAEPDAESFARAILDAARSPEPAPDLAPYDWSKLAEVVEKALPS